MAIKDQGLVGGLWHGRDFESVRIRARKFYKHAGFSISTQVFYKHAHALIWGGLQIFYGRFLFYVGVNIYVLV